jgi:hypothetical protein
MFGKKLPIEFSQLGSYISLLLICLLSNPQNVLTQTRPNNQPIESNSIQFRQPQMPDNGAPEGRRRGGTSRDGCPSLSSSLTALVPGKETEGEAPLSASFLATTIAEYPTFWVYLPQLPQNTRSGEFVLQDEEGIDIYRTSLALPESGGIVGLNFPSSSPALKIGKKYHWYFQLYCGEPDTQPEYFFVDAWIERVALSPEMATQLQAKQTQKYLVYAKHSLWYDALTDLAARHSNNLNNERLKNDWVKLLKSVGLQDLAFESVFVQHR